MDEESKTKQGQPDDANEFLHRELIATFRLDSVDDFEATARTKTISMEGLMKIRRLAHDNMMGVMESAGLTIEPEFELDPIVTFTLEYHHCEDSEAGLQIGFELSACECVDESNFRDRIAELICKVEPAFTDGLRRQGVSLQ